MVWPACVLCVVGASAAGSRQQAVPSHAAGTERPAQRQCAPHTAAGPGGSGSRPRAALLLQGLLASKPSCHPAACLLLLPPPTTTAVPAALAQPPAMDSPRDTRRRINNKDEVRAHTPPPARRQLPARNMPLTLLSA